MYQRVGVPQIVQELISKALSLMRSWDKSCNVKQLDRYRAASVDTGAVVRLTSIRDVVAGACTINLKVSNGALGIYGCETISISVEACASVLDISYGKLPGNVSLGSMSEGYFTHRLWMSHQSSY
jgi:hypothetical protein